MKINHKPLSIFMQWVIGLIVSTVIAVCIYLVVLGLGGIKAWEDAVRCSDMQLWAHILAITGIASFAVGYIIVSLYTLLSHRAIEDSRMHCLTFIISPIFLIIENGLVHLFSSENGTTFYSTTMPLFATMVAGVITFSSLKFSFEISTQKSRLLETSKVKPDISIVKRNGNFIFKSLRNPCYFCGLYIGEISKIFYLDIKKTGTCFRMNKLMFTNRKYFYDKTDEFSSAHLLEIDNFIDRQTFDTTQSEHTIFAIFRDTVNYYYFVQLPKNNEDDIYNVIGANEYIMTRLVYLDDRNKYQDKKRKKVKTEIKYCAMDWFKIPYSFEK